MTKKKNSLSPTQVAYQSKQKECKSPESAFTKEDYLFTDNCSIDKSIEHTISLVRLRVRFKIDQIFYRKIKENVFKAHSLDDVVKRQYILNCVLNSDILKSTRETWIDLATVFTLLNTNNCVNKEQSKLFYQSALSMLGLDSLPQSFVKELKENLIAYEELSLKISNQLVRETFYTYTMRSGQLKLKFDLRGYKSIATTWTKIKSFETKLKKWPETKLTNGEEELLAFCEITRVEYRENFYMKRDKIDSLIKSIRSAFIIAIIDVLVMDYSVQDFDLMGTGRVKFLMERLSERCPLNPTFLKLKNDYDKKTNRNEFDMGFITFILAYKEDLKAEMEIEGE